jgi:predicted MFS family arabinose efflux permease
MASYYIFARQFSAARFATLAAVMLGVGSFGNLVASYPMAWAAETIGWRAALWGLGGISVAVAFGVLALVRDPEAVKGEARGSLLDLLRMPVIWSILPLMFVAYAPAAGLRGLWAGPYLRDVFGLDTVQVGQATLVMGMAMIAGTFAYGPLDRVFKSRKWVIFTGNVICAAALLTLMFWPDRSLGLSIALLAVIGIAGSTYPVLIAHGRAFVPAHLAGRGVTLLNLFGIGGAGVAQFASGPLFASAATAGALAGYTALFALFAFALVAGLVIYLFSRDSMD